MVKILENMKKQNMSKVYPQSKHPIPAVGAFILNSQNQILLVKSYKWGNLYCVPGGRIEIGEKSETTLIREVKEEVGLEISRFHFLCFLDAIFSKEFFKKRHFLFLNFACFISGDQKVKLDNKELEDYKWIELDRCLKYPLNQYTRATIINYLIPFIKNYKKP